MNLNLMAPINQLGYGIAGLNISLALHKAGCNVALFPIGNIEVPDTEQDVIAKLQANSAAYENNASCLRIWHQNQQAEFVGRGDRIAFPFFELDKFNYREKHHMSNTEVVFVASEWAKKVVIEQAKRYESDVHVIPLGVDRTIFNEDVPQNSLQPDYTTFINVGKWEIRKGHDVLLRAFNRAFTPSDKVALVMVPTNPFIGDMNSRWQSMYLGSPMGRNIQILPRLTDQKTLASVMAMADCGVFPARAEGWNLDLLEMLSMGKHVICTNNTGHTAFTTNNNSRLISCEEKEKAEDGVWFHGQGNWHKLGDEQEEQLIVYMREVHRLKQTSKLLANKAGIETAKRFSWDNTAGYILKVLG